MTIVNRKNTARAIRMYALFFAATSCRVDGAVLVEAVLCSVLDGEVGDFDRRGDGDLEPLGDLERGGMIGDSCLLSMIRYDRRYRLCATAVWVLIKCKINLKRCSYTSFSFHRNNIEQRHSSMSYYR